MTTVAARAQCAGVLLVHLDASTAACTEELEGRCCPGPDAVHQGGPVSCQELLGPGACEICVPEAWTERDWRHVAHVAHFARSARRCAAHVAPRRAAWSPEAPVAPVRRLPSPARR